MSTGLEVRIWCAEQPPGEVVVALVRALREVVGDLVVERWTTSERQGAQRRDVTLEEAKQIAGTSTRVAAIVALPCWRHGTRGAVAALVSAWGPAHHSVADPEFDGTASLWLQHHQPFLAVGAEDDPHQVENSTLLVDVMTAFAQNVAPVRMLLVQEGVFPCVLNAHAVWRSRRADLLRDLAQVRALWSDGRSAWGVRPLSVEESEDVWHPARTAVQRATLRARLEGRIDRWPGPRAVDEALASGGADRLEIGDGVLVLDLPHPCAALVAELYVSILDAPVDPRLVVVVGHLEVVLNSESFRRWAAGAVKHPAPEGSAEAVRLRLDDPSFDGGIVLSPPVPTVDMLQLAGWLQKVPDVDGVGGRIAAAVLTEAVLRLPAPTAQDAEAYRWAHQAWRADPSIAAVVRVLAATDVEGVSPLAALVALFDRPEAPTPAEVDEVVSMITRSDEFPV